jgi:dATP pyrophosphohydrolase
MAPLKYIDVFPFARSPQGLQFLLLHRKATNSYPEIWQPVSGKIKSGETAWQAGLRELQEETGFVPQNFYALDHVSNYYLHAEDRVISVPAFIAEVALHPPRLNHEHDAYAWLSLTEAKKRASWNPYRQALHAIPDLLASSPALARPALAR